LFPFLPRMDSPLAIGKQILEDGFQLLMAGPRQVVSRQVGLGLDMDLQLGIVGHFLPEKCS